MPVFGKDHAPTKNLTAALVPTTPIKEAKMASTLALSPIRREPLSRRHGNRSRFLIAATLFIVVLIAEAAVVALAPANTPDITSLYIATT
jgi:3-oxoacyl-[acyl-carrier-protein] synthase III